MLKYISLLKNPYIHVKYIIFWKNNKATLDNLFDKI